jgi:hypothetical protein
VTGLRKNEALFDLLWAVFVLAGCAYLVFGLGHSGWWFLLALVFLDRSFVHGEKISNACLREDAERWRALIGCARISAMGCAGLETPKENGYAHLTVNLWTVSPDGSDPMAARRLRQFADIAVRLRRERHEQR